MFKLAIVLTALLFFNACSHNTAKKDQLSLGMTDWTGYQPILWAEKQYLAQGAIDINELPSNTEIVRLFNNHAIDMACVTLGDAILLSHDNDDILIIAVLDISNGADALVVKPDITSLAKLKGKRIGLEQDGAGNYMLARVLEKAGLKKEDITLKIISFFNHESVFANNSVDALITYEPAVSKLISQGALKLFDSSMIPNEIFDVLIVKKETLSLHPKEIRSIVQAWYRAAQDIKSANPAALSWLAAYLQRSTAGLQNEFSQIDFLTATEAKQLLLSKRFDKVTENTHHMIHPSDGADDLEKAHPLIDRASIDSLY